MVSLAMRLRRWVVVLGWFSDRVVVVTRVVWALLERTVRRLCARSVVLSMDLGSMTVVFVLVRVWVPVDRRLFVVVVQGTRTDGWLTVVTLVSDDVLVWSMIRRVVVICLGMLAKNGRILVGIFV